MTPMTQKLTDPHEVSLTNIELSDVIDAPALQELMDAYFALNGLAFAIIDIKGEMLVSGGWQDICAKFHRAHPESCKFCHESDSSLASGIAPGTFKAYRCKNNLWDIVTPIMLGERQVGNIFMGQLFFDGEELDYELFRAQAKRFGYDETAYIAALDRVPRYSREFINKAMSFCSKLAQMISRSNFNNKILADTLAKQKLAEEALRESEAKLAESEGILRDIVESTLSGFWDWNLVNNTEHLSPTFKRMFGYEDHEMESSPEAWQRIIFPEDLPGVLEVFDRHVKSHGREPFSNEVRYQHRDGSTVWVICAGRVIEWADDGTPIRMVGCHIDITARKQAEQSLLESEYFFRESQRVARIGSYQAEFYPDDFWKTSEVCDDIFGIDAGYNRTVQGWIDLLHPDNAQEMIDYVTNEVIGKGVPFDKEYCIIRYSDKANRWLRGHGQTMIDNTGRTTGLIGTIQDVTERKEAEETIETARKQLAAKNKELEQIIYVASHDLRSPLVNVDGFSRELEYSVNELSALFEGGGDYAALEKALRAEFPDMVKSIGRIRASTRQMDNLLKAMLKLARAGRAALRIETLNMDELLGQLVSSFAFRLRETGMTMTVEQLPPCQGDAVQATQVFSNLIDNAIKYHEKERPGVITIRGTAEGGRALYRIEDNGMGIAESHREKIFELFHRLNPKAGEGEGLGLTLVRQILGGMNGEITVESKMGEGSAFIVSLPGIKMKRQ